MAEKGKALGNILLSKKLITEVQLNEALEDKETSKEKLEKVLVRLGFITEDILCDVLSEQYGIERVRLDDYIIPQEVVDIIPANVAKKERIIPIKKEGNVLYIAISNPLSVLMLDKLQMIYGYEIKEVLATEQEIRDYLGKFHGVGEETVESMIKEFSERMEYLPNKQRSAMEEAEVEASDADAAPIIKLVNFLILEACRAEASDIHIEPLEENFRVRYRIDGKLKEVQGPPQHLQNAVISRIKLQAGIDIAEKRRPRDGKFYFHRKEGDIDVRVSTLPGQYGESVVLRLLLGETVNRELSSLGFSEEDEKKFEILLGLDHGIILVTGPTGSGKTTTLYAALTKLNTPTKKIITIEDPVEYQITGLNQIQVLPQIGKTYANVLRSILRQAPDIIMVGEIRDEETLGIAIRTALTGHLVFSTLHTNDAPSAITRLVDMKAKPFMVSSTVEAILAQRLVQVICPNCKEAYPVRKDELIEMNMTIDQIPDGKLYKGRGCSFCQQRGYKGRIGIYELLIMNDEIRDSIMKGGVSLKLKDIARKQGMKTLREDGWDKVIKGITTTEQVMYVTSRDVEEANTLAEIME
jgi:type IV pilus assembly protein PilB